MEGWGGGVRGSTAAVRSRGCRCHCDPWEQAHRWRGNRFSRITRCAPVRGPGGQPLGFGVGWCPDPRPPPAPNVRGEKGGRARPAGPANERRRAASSGEAARKGVCARAPGWLHRAREVGERTPPRAREQEQVWGRAPGARGPLLPSLRSPPPARTPPLGYLICMPPGGSRVCACGGRPGRRVGRGGGEGARPLTARARAAAPPHGAALEAPPTAPSPPRSDPRPLRTKGRSRPRLPSPRPRWPRAESNPRTHDNQVETPSLPRNAPSGAQ